MAVKAEHRPAKPAVQLLATSLEDLSVISALVQDALVTVGDMAYLADDKSFVMVINRYCWECEPHDGHERIHSGLRFDHVERVRYRGIDRRNRELLLELLCVTTDSQAVVLHFAGGGAIRLEVSTMLAAVEDLDEPWPTPSVPRHDEA